LLFASVALFILMYYRSAVRADWFDIFTLYPQNGIIAPLELISFFLIPTSLYLLFFNKTIQQAWWRWARFALLVPFAVIILMLPTYEGGGLDLRCSYRLLSSYSCCQHMKVVGDSLALAERLIW